MKLCSILEAHDPALIKMMTQGLTHLKLTPQEVKVKLRKHAASQAKACFNNAFKALKHDSKYVLGYMFFHGIPIEHAWVKEGDTYYDVTLDPAKQESYVSLLELSHDEVFEYIEQHHSAPSLYDLNRFYGKRANK